MSAIINWDMIKNDNSTEKIKSMLNAIIVINDNSHIKPNEEKNVTGDDFRVHRNNPHGNHSWLFQGLNKNRS